MGPVAGPAGAHIEHQAGSGAGGAGGQATHYGPVGHLMQAFQQLRWESQQGWWLWQVQGQAEELHLVLARVGGLLGPGTRLPPPPPPSGPSGPT